MKKVLVLFFLTFLTFYLGPGVVSAEQLTIQFNGSSYNSEQFHTYLSLKGNISYDTLEAIRNGITANLYITFQLGKGGGLFRSVGDIIVERVETFTISYDVWENNFIVQDRKRNIVHNVPRSGEIISKISEIIDPLSFQVALRYKGEKLLLRAKIKIQTIKLYPPFGIFLYFFDPWNYESSWFYTDKFTLETL